MNDQDRFAYTMERLALNVFGAICISLGFLAGYLFGKKTNKKSG